ncbi:MAG: Ig-like domain-containing protein, partial [Gemmatimonadota bacterium]
NNYTVWFNDVQYENLPAGQVGAPTGVTTGWPAPTTVALGSPFQLIPAPNTVSYATPALPNGGKLTDVAWGWYTLTSSSPSVATVSADGLVTGVAAGSTNISATMNGLAASGSASITVTAPLGVPGNNAPTPSVTAANVISLFSTAYTNQGVDTWQTSWSTCCNQLVDPFAILNGHAVKQYSLAHFVGVEFGFANPANTVDATTMTHFHVDVWSPNPSPNFQIRLVDFSTGSGVEGNYNPGQVMSGSWVSLDIPLSSFTGLTTKSALRQLLLLVNPGETTVLYIDNVYFHK